MKIQILHLDNSAFYETLSRKLGYTFSASEQTEINKFIRKATILAPKSHPDAKQENLHAIQAGILTSSTKERLEQLEETKRELEARIAEEKLAKPKVTEEFIRFWLLRFRKLDMSLKDQRQALVDTFINSIYLYDDKVLITFNYKEGTQTVTFGEAVEVASEGNGSDLDCFTAPENAVKSKDFMAFLFYKPWLHGFCTVFARSVLSMSDDVGRCIALQSVPFFASGEQG